jgi:hypothetical protein
MTRANRSVVYVAWQVGTEIKMLADSDIGELAKVIAFAIIALVSIIGGVIKKRVEAKSKKPDPPPREIEFDLGELLGERRPPPPPPRKKPSKPRMAAPRPPAPRVRPQLAPQARVAEGLARVAEVIDAAAMASHPKFATARLVSQPERPPPRASPPMDVATEKARTEAAADARPSSLSLRQAIIWAEIIGPPKALQESCNTTPER